MGGTCHGIEDGNGKETEPDHEQAGDRSSLECHVERFLKARLGRLGGAHVGADRNAHADEPGNARAHGPDREPRGDFPIKKRAKDEEYGDADHGHHLILAGHVRIRALLDGKGNPFHLAVAGRLLKNPLGKVRAVGEGENRRADGIGED